MSTAVSSCTGRLKSSMEDYVKNVLDMFRLNGRRALVTGGAKGLGQVIATALAEAGADVIIVSRTLSDCEAAAAAIRKTTGPNAYPIAADASRAAQADRLFRES